MKKLFSKISALFLGLAMAIGVGAAIGSNASVSGVNAADQVLTFDLSKNPGGWPASNSTTLTNYNYTLSGTSYTFALKNVKCNSGYLMLTATAVLGLPAIDGYKLTKVVAKNTSGCSKAVNVGISSSPSSASYITGGAIQTWSTTSSSYTYNLSGTNNNTVYYLYVTNKNAQITELALTYGEVVVNRTVTFAVNTAEYGTVSSSSLSVPSGSSITTNGNTVTINGTTVTATPAAATAQYTYSFSSWSNATGSVTTDRTITANFTRETKSFSITKTYNNCSGNAPTSVQYGSLFTDTITPNTGYHVPSTVSVTVGSETRSVTPSGNILTVSNVTGDVSYTVTCEINSYSITGNISNGTLSNDGESINHGTAYSGTINPTGTALLPDDKDDIVVTIGGSSTTNFDYDPSTGVVNIADQYVTGDIVITAACYYVYFISPSCVGGSVDYDQSDSNIRSDGTAMIQFVANEGYLLPSIDGISITSDNADIIEYADGLVEIGNATGNVTIVCTCIEITDKDIHVNVTNATASGDTTITIGGEAKVNLDADDGYRLPYEDEFTVTGADADFEFNQEHTTVEISLSSCVDDVVISGSSVHRWNISTEITNGSCSPTSGVVDNGDEWSTTLSPNAHYKLPQKSDIAVTMGGSSTDDFTYSNGTISLTNITGDVSISASMIALATYTVTFNASNISGPSSGTIEEGGIEEYTFTVSGDYHLPDEDEIIVEPNNCVEWSWVEESDTTGVLTISNPISDVDVTISGKPEQLVDITLSTNEGTYILGEEFKKPTVTATYLYRDPQNVTDRVVVSNYDRFTTGTKDVEISFTDYGKTITKSYTATVKAAEYYITIPGETTYFYQKLVSGDTVTSGGYLITYNNSLALNSSLDTLDAASNVVSITTKDNKITFSDPTDPDTNPYAGYEFTYDSVAKTLKSKNNSGHYIYHSGSKNTLNTSTNASTAKLGGITINEQGHAVIDGNDDYVLRFNDSATENRFRFYKGTQQAIDLYQYKSETGPEQKITSDEKHAIRIASATCTKQELIENQPITVDDFSISVQFDTANTIFDGYKPTDVSPSVLLKGTHDYTLTYEGDYDDIVTKTISLTATEEPILSSIRVEHDSEWSHEFTRLDDFDTTGVHVWASYSNGYADREVTDEPLCNIVEPDMSVAGQNIEVPVTYTENGVTKDTSYYITINPIHTRNITTTIKDSDDVTLELIDGYYNIVPNESYYVSFTVDGDYEDVQISGGTNNTKIVNNVLFSDAESNETVTFPLQCDLASSSIPVKVIAAKDANLKTFKTVDKGATASVINQHSGTFTGYVNNTVSIEIELMNFTNPVVTPKTSTTALTLTGNTVDSTYTGTISVNSTLINTLYEISVKEDGEDEETIISLMFTSVEDSIVSISVSNQKTIYTVGESFDSSMTVTGTYDSTKTRELNENEYNITGVPEVMKRGTYEITVSLKTDSSVYTSYFITVNKEDGLYIVTGKEETVPDPDHPVPGTESSDGDWKWVSLSSGRIAKNSYIANNQSTTAPFDVYASSITVSFDGKSSTGTNAGSKFTFELQGLNENEEVVKSISNTTPYTLQTTNTNFSLTLSGLEYSDEIVKYKMICVDKIQSGSANSNIVYSNTKVTYKSFVPGTKTVTHYSYNDVSDELYDFITAIYNNPEYYTCDKTTGLHSDLDNWSKIVESKEYKALSANDKKLLKEGVISGTDEFGTKQSCKLFNDFITQYEYIVRKYGPSYDYLQRGIVSNSNSRPFMTLLNTDSAVWVVGSIGLISLISVGAYFYIRRKKEN